MNGLIIFFYAAAFVLMFWNLLSIHRKKERWRSEFGFELVEKFHTVLSAYECLIFAFAAFYLVFFMKDLSMTQGDNWHFLLCMILFWGAIFVRLSIDVIGRLLRELWKELNRTITDLAEENRLFLDIIPGGVRSSVMQGDKLRVRHVNRRFVEMTGYDQEEICSMEEGCLTSLCYGQDDREKLEYALKDVMEHRRETSVEYRIRNRKGDLVWVAENFLPVRNTGETYLLISTIIDISERVENEEAERSRLVKDSETDLLTGLLNKVTFEKKAEAYINENQEGYAAFLLIDLDDFKHINDNFGHPCGDDALRKTSRFLTDVLEKNGATVGRIGGDEFMALLPGIRDEAQLKREVKKLEDEFVLNLITPDGSQYAYTGSVGYCVLPCRGLVFQDYYRRVDSVLYKVKKEHKEKTKRM